MVPVLISVVARMAHEMEEEQVLSIRNKVDTLTIQCHFLTMGQKQLHVYCDICSRVSSVCNGKNFLKLNVYQ